MGMFIVGLLVGICLGIAGRDLWQYVEFLWFLGAERRRKKHIERGIKKLNKHINKDK
tara:strand:- start:169 stop:339 length:171 start_codon:yes stop_codon:yes gene_type:complete